MHAPYDLALIAQSWLGLQYTPKVLVKWDRHPTFDGKESDFETATEQKTHSVDLGPLGCTFVSTLDGGQIPMFARRSPIVLGRKNATFACKIRLCAAKIMTVISYRVPMYWVFPKMWVPPVIQI